MMRTHRCGELRSEHALEWSFFGRDDAHFQSTCSQRRSNLEPNEARPDDDGLLCLRHLLDQRPTIPQRAEVLNALRSGKVEANWNRAGCNQQAAVIAGRAVAEVNGFGIGVDTDRFDAGQDLDALGLIKLSGMQR